MRDVTPRRRFVITREIRSHLISIWIMLALLLLFVFGFSAAEDWIYRVFPNAPSSHADYSLPRFTGQFLQVALTAAAIAAPIGFFLGVFCFTETGKPFRSVIERFATIINTIPTIAVLLIVVSVVGYGVWPTIAALLVQAILPITFATISGMSNVQPSCLEAGRSLGMTPRQIRWRVQIPLALPVILSGFKTSLILCIAASTLANSSGAGGLGRLIMAGYDSYNNIFVIEGAVPICLIALLAEQIVTLIGVITARGRTPQAT